MTHTAHNPLLEFDHLPQFDQIKPAHVAPALETLLQQAETALETVTASGHPADWQAMACTLDVPIERLGRTWGLISHLSAVADTPELRAAYNAALPLISTFFTRLGSNEKLYEKYKAIDSSKLDTAQQKALKNTKRDFVLGGAELSDADKKEYEQINQRLAELSQKFSENVLDATDAFVYYAQADELNGVPADVLENARSAAKNEDREGHKITLQLPCYLPIMQFAENRTLRELLYRAYVTRASDQASADAKAFDNSAIMQEILQWRQKEARLLGFENFADLSLVTKMADSPQQVVTFLNDLALRARPYAERDVQQMGEFAAAELDLKNPETWDWAYVGEKLKSQRYAFTEQDIKPYFPAPKVLAGLFDLVSQLFEVTIQQESTSVWDPTVQFFRIERSGTLVGQFYLDMQARTGKRGGAWMDGARTRWLRPDTNQLQTPIAWLVCNFASPVGNQPALLTHDDVITLFHEFGHGLHHLLSQVNEHDVSGIGGVEWDAVEMPSQFMENFCWQWPVLQGLTQHVESGEPMPRALFEKMLAAKNHQAGLQTLRQVEFALFDMRLHTDHAANPSIESLMQAIRHEVAVLQPPAFNRMPNTFSHIFAGGYAAGYYSYKWAELLSADAFAAFEESMLPDGKPDLQTARRWRSEVLEVGGSRPAIESFRAFRGRDPEIAALMRHQGMAEEALIQS